MNVELTRLQLIGWENQLRGVLCDDEKRNTATGEALVEDRVEADAKRSSLCLEFVRYFIYLRMFVKPIFFVSS